MARPRQRIQIDGRSIDSVIYHRPSKRYHIIDQTGRRVYFALWRDARTAYHILTIAGHR